MDNEEMSRQIKAQLNEVNKFKLAQNPISNAINSTNEEKDRVKNMTSMQKKTDNTSGGVPIVKNITSQFKNDTILRMNTQFKNTREEYGERTKMVLGSQEEPLSRRQ